MLCGHVITKPARNILHGTADYLLSVLQEKMTAAFVHKDTLVHRCRGAVKLLAHANWDTRVFATMNDLHNSYTELHTVIPMHLCSAGKAHDGKTAKAFTLELPVTNR
jgi:hypothetical protein